MTDRPANPQAEYRRALGFGDAANALEAADTLAPKAEQRSSPSSRWPAASTTRRRYSPTRCAAGPRVVLRRPARGRSAPMSETPLNDQLAEHDQRIHAAQARARDLARTVAERSRALEDLKAQTIAAHAADDEDAAKRLKPKRTRLDTEVADLDERRAGADLAARRAQDERRQFVVDSLDALNAERRADVEARAVELRQVLTCGGAGRRPRARLGDERRSTAGRRPRKPRRARRGLPPGCRGRTTGRAQPGAPAAGRARAASRDGRPATARARGAWSRADRDRMDFGSRMTRGMGGVYQEQRRSGPHSRQSGSLCLRGGNRFL